MVAGVRTRLRAGWSRVRNLAGNKTLSSLYRPDRLRTPTPVQWEPVFFPGGKATGAWIEHLRRGHTILMSCELM